VVIPFGGLRSLERKRLRWEDGILENKCRDSLRRNKWGEGKTLSSKQTAMPLIISTSVGALTYTVASAVDFGISPALMLNQDGATMTTYTNSIPEPDDRSILRRCREMRKCWTENESVHHQKIPKYEGIHIG